MRQTNDHLSADPTPDDDSGRGTGSLKDIIHRDQVHGDVQYDRLSVALLNTGAMQRLGRVYQLGYSHLVYRGGTHTRLSHVMGAAHMAGKIVDALRVNYKQNRAARPQQHVAEPLEFLPCSQKNNSTACKYTVTDRWDILRHLVTWAALLHDLGHVPLGHTLEDEFEGIFKKHDDFASPRSLYLWGARSEIYQILTDTALHPPSFARCDIDSLQIWQAVMLICYFKDVPADLTDDCSDFSDYLKYSVRTATAKLKEKQKATTQGRAADSVTPEDQKSELENHRRFARVLLDAAQNTKEIFRPFMTDIVANTICADYLDYVRRDPLNVGLDVLRDDRILSSFYVGSDSTGLRMALALLDRHGKPRLDVCTGVVEQVRQRYRFAESIYYHKTKVSASAMFAKAMTLIGKPPEIGKEQDVLFDKGREIQKIARGISRSHEAFSNFKARCLPSALMHTEIGDEGLHLWLVQRAINNIERALQPRKIVETSGKQTSVRRKENKSSSIAIQLRGIALLQGIMRRRLYKISFSIDALHFGKLTKGAGQEGVVESRLQSALKRLRKDKGLRDRLERKLAYEVGWPEDSILLYVPPRKSQAKGIETFAFDGNGLVRLNEHEAVSEKVNELGKDYRDLWRLLVLTHPLYQENNLDLSRIADVLTAEFWSDFSEETIVAENGNAANLHDEDRVSTIREVAWFPYIRKDHRGAAAEMDDLSVGLPKGMKVNWEMFERAPILSTDSENTLSDVRYAERAFVIQCLVRQHGMSEAAAIGRVKERYPGADDSISSKNPEIDHASLKLLLRKKRSYSKAENEETLRALDLQRVASELAAGPTQAKPMRRSTLRASLSRTRRRHLTRTSRSATRPAKKKAG